MLLPLFFGCYSKIETAEVPTTLPPRRLLLFFAVPSTWHIVMSLENFEKVYTEAFLWEHNGVGATSASLRAEKTDGDCLFASPLHGEQTARPDARADGKGKDGWKPSTFRRSFLLHLIQSPPNSVLQQCCREELGLLGAASHADVCKAAAESLDSCRSVLSRVFSVPFRKSFRGLRLFPALFFFQVVCYLFGHLPEGPALFSLSLMPTSPTPVFTI
jgi:hypothetical protein